MAEPFGFHDVEPGHSTRANRGWWDGEAVEYYAEHGAFLGDDDLCWGPEGLRESNAGLLGELTGLTVLEVGCGAAQGARWALSAGAARVVATDLSHGMLAQGAALTVEPDDRLALVQADACVLPVASSSIDLAFSAYGAVPFVDNPDQIMREAYRVLKPGGRWVFSVTHPFRWAFPDDPGEGGLTVTRSYFDRTPYRELTEAGELSYAEHHRTVGDRVRDVVSVGFVLENLVEPEWPESNTQVWGAWSPLRGRLFPGTLIISARKTS